VGAENFYREQAMRLTRIAREASDPQTKAELLDIAAQFLTLAEYAENRAAYAEDAWDPDHE
jgi:hypothetical protein